MARADRRRAAREARHVQRRPRVSGGGARIAEETMFFPKLRAHARWMFVLLAIVFAGGFVFLGVGSGSSGIGDLFQGNFGDLFGGGATSSQVKKDRERIKNSPKDYAAYRDLAAALAADDKLDEAIATLEQLRTLQPKTSAGYADGVTLLAGLYLRQADAARAEGQAIQQQAAALVAPSTFAPDPRSKLGQAVGSSDAIVNAFQSQLTGKLSDVYGRMTQAFTQAVSAYKQVAAVTPSDPGVQFALAQTAEQAADTKTAIAAYKRFLKLAPDDPTAPAIRQRLKQLQQQSKTTGS